MKIDKVTMTGADDSIKPEKLFEISEKYPFVEWGLLASRNSRGSNRFPSKEWLDEFNKLHPIDLNLSVHLCGNYVKEILMGGARCFDELFPIIGKVDRCQINTHGVPHQYDREGFSKILSNNYHAEFIMQFDEVNKDILKYFAPNHKNISTLFDMSHGAGLLPSIWPEPIENIYCGYAGGLGPENIKNQLEVINNSAGDKTIWIDMETKIRSNNDLLFDIEKVETVLKMVQDSGYLF